MGKTRVLKFLEGVDVSNPNDALPPGVFGAYPDDASFVVAVGRPAQDGDVYYNTTEDIVKVYNATDDEWTSVATAGGTPLVRAFARGVLSLPTGPSVVIDGVTIQADDLVCFPDIDNKVYEAVGTGGNITGWTAEKVFADNSDTPSPGESVRVQEGDTFSTQLAVYDGSTFEINNVVRYYTDGNYWEQGAIINTALADNTTGGTVFQVSAAQSENLVLDYSITRGSDKAIGQLLITHQNLDGDIPIADTGAATGDLGVSFGANVGGGNVTLTYDTTSTGSGASMKYSLKRWSDASGGPDTPPSYSPGGGADVPAAGAISGIQFHGGDGNLASNSNFNWNDSDQALELGGLNFSILKQSTLIDNQIDQIIFTIPVAEARHMLMEYSIARDGDSRVGRKIIFTDALDAIHETEDFTEPVATGITLTSDVDSGNIRFKYSSTATGQNATFKYSLRYWS